MKTSVIGKTDATLTLNKCKTYIRGRSEAIIDVVNDEQKTELAVLERQGLVVVIGEDELDPQIEAPKTMSEVERVSRSEAETQKMGAKAFVVTGDGVKEGRMVHSTTDQFVESEATRESLETMERLEKEEQADDLVINEDKLDVSERMGNKAVVGTGADNKHISLVNNAIPGSENIKKSDPFIDRSSKEKSSIDKDKKEEVVDITNIDLPDGDLFIGGDSPTNEDGEDPFIEI